jgi:hypothetical protein
MRDEKTFSAVSESPTLSAEVTLSRAQWEALPISARVSDRIVEILVLATEIRAELETDHGAPLRWLVPEIERVMTDADELLRRLAS